MPIPVGMRAILEYLGIVEPERERREPIALPARARWLAPLIVALVIAGLTLLSTGVWAVMRSLMF